MFLGIVSLPAVEYFEMFNPSVRFDAVRVRRKGEHDRGFASKAAGAEFPALSQIVDEEVDLSRTRLQ